MSEARSSIGEALRNLPVDAEPGQVARALRQSLGLSLKQMAAKLGDGVHFTTVAKLETGKMKFSLEWADMFSLALDVSTSAFFLPYDEINPAIRVPVYIGLDFIRHRDSVSPHHHTAYLTEKAGLFGVYLTGIYDMASEGGVGTAIIDPARTDLIEGRLYLVADLDINEAVVGIYRGSLGVARLIPWPTQRDAPLHLTVSRTEILGEVVELQRTFVSGNS